MSIVSIESIVSIVFIVSIVSIVILFLKFKKFSPVEHVTPLSGGYCGGVPPLPIPNREVKPACADGTAMQCGRVGGRLFFNQQPHSEKGCGFFLYILHNLPSSFFKTFCLFIFVLHIFFIISPHERRYVLCQEGYSVALQVEALPWIWRAVAY